MFTGIVEETGVVRAIHPSANSIRLSVEASRSTRGESRIKMLSEGMPRLLEHAR